MTTRAWGLVAVAVCGAGCRESAPTPAVSEPPVAVAAVERLESRPEAPPPRSKRATDPAVELPRLRKELDLLDGDIKKVINLLARERVGANHLKEKCDEMAAKQAKDREQLLARGQAIKDAEPAGAAAVTFGDRKLTVAQAKVELAQAVNRFQAHGKTLTAFQEQLKARVKVRDVLEKQLGTLKNHKDELRAAVETLETELQMPKLRQVESKSQNDAGRRLAKIKEDIEALRRKLATPEVDVKPKDQTVDDILRGLDPKNPEPKRQRN